MHRLHEDPSDVMARSVRRILTIYAAQPPREQRPADVVEDQVAAAILRMFHPVTLQEYLPVTVVGDGNCLFRSASMGLHGHADRHLYLRLITTLEMIEHRSVYDISAISHQTDRPPYHSSLFVAPYRQMLTEVTKPGERCEMLHVYALSAALGVAIQSYMPPASSLSIGYAIYTCAVIGRGVDPSSSPAFTLMWSSAVAPLSQSNFIVNHVVILQRRPQLNTISPAVDDSDSDTRHTLCSDSDVEETSSVAPTQSNDVDDIEHEDSFTFLKPLPRADGLSTEEVIALVTAEVERDVAPQVPRGEKSDVYVVVDNTSNIHRKAVRHNNVFEDDCGGWKSTAARAIKHHYLRQQSTYKKLFWVAGQQKYCREVKVGGKRTYVPYDPQPAADDVVVVERYYAVLSANEHYKRRVTWLIGNDGSVSDVALFEYFGQHTTAAPHGNSKRPNADPYVRTPAATMSKIDNMITAERPQDVYNQLILENDVTSAPRDSRVVRNKKNRLTRSAKTTHGRHPCNNFGDELQMVMELLKTDDFIRRVVAQRDCVPCVILYNDRQLSDIRGLCFDRQKGSVLGFDKTFNLGSAYVTASVYKNTALTSKRSGDSPIFLGPLYIHGRSDTDTYADFFGHLSSKFMGCDFQALTIGSDEEQAMRKCMIHFFPRARTVVCSRHLKENAGRKLDEVLGKSSDLRRRVMAAVFGDDGLTSYDNVVAFDNAVEKLRQHDGLLSSVPTSFRQYFDGRVLQLLRDNCAAGKGTWTNNNCESMNHVLKQTVQWRRNQLPDLIDKLRSLVTGQQADADRALCGRGDYSLRPEWTKHRPVIFQCYTCMRRLQF